MSVNPLVLAVAEKKLERLAWVHTVAQHQYLADIDMFLAHTLAVDNKLFLFGKPVDADTFHEAKILLLQWSIDEKDHGAASQVSG